MTLLELSNLARQFWVAWLMLVFVAIAFYAYRPRNRRHFDDCAKIPFTTDTDD
ncbi:MAG TPA: cbb3-type cytochrome c oxidase subunit 3 [Dongiaceae bacterium]|jgi:cytochrome c oxidase cbb3-type subunit 4|nr:cbb3-type cytochrome c oxidase subunit 3 [Dongiaceae bacterium]